MNSPGSSHPDAARSRLRAIVNTVDGEIARLTLPDTAEDGKALPNGLRTSWDKLVTELALGPEPDVRECPQCHHIGMRAANVCGYCWTPLAPPAKGSSGSAPV
jgi:hypothetical protein